MVLWSKLNYKTRLFMLIMIFTWIVVFVLSGIFYYREKEFKAESLNAKLQIYNAQLLSALKNSFEEGISYVNYINNNDSVRFTILDTAGVVIYDTHGIPRGTEHIDRLEVYKAIEFGHGFTQSRTSTSDNRPYFYSAMKDDNYIVRTSLPYDLTLVQALQNEPVYIWTILIISVALSILAFLASRQFGQNVARLRDFAAQAEKGTLTENLDFPNDELGDISKHIINIYNKNQLVSKERDEYYENLLSEEHEKARIKHQLTNNINHELKTPIHSIQGCLETIIENKEQLDKDQIIAFVGKSYEQVKRLCALMNDISIMTRMTDAPAQIMKENLDLILIVTEMKEEIELLPTSRRMRCNVDLPEKMPIQANRSLLESIFKNLIDNSLAYSGGRDIFISLLHEDEKSYMISYSDNGVGVSESHYPRIFERFYRIDEGRSRKMGGTGLGLSIVKNSVLFHGGDIQVQTRKGGGLEFVFSLNKI